MPELPEVETVRRALSLKLPGKSIVKILVRDARLRWPVQPGKLHRLVMGKQIGQIRRRAKYLLVDLQAQSTLIIHLGMSGRLLLLTDSQPFEKHDHVIFYLDDGAELRFRDTRRFGMIDAVSNVDLDRYGRFLHLGLEPLARSTTAEKLFERAKNSKKPIKNLLMDAQFIVGVGNIYANEALFQARIHPSMPTNRLSPEDWQRLLSEVKRVLRKAIRKGGTTLNTFVDSNGEMGYFQLSLAAYGRAGEACPRCNATIKRFVQVGRSTFYCPSCQAEP